MLAVTQHAKMGYGDKGVPMGLFQGSCYKRRNLGEIPMGHSWERITLPFHGLCMGKNYPPNKGHFGNNIAKFKSFVLCREVVLFSEVQNVLEP